MTRIRWTTSGNMPYLWVALDEENRLIGVLEKVRGTHLGDVWYAWRGYFQERAGGPFRSEREAQLYFQSVVKGSAT